MENPTSSPANAFRATEQTIPQISDTDGRMDGDLRRVRLSAGAKNGGTTDRRNRRSLRREVRLRRSVAHPTANRLFRGGVLWTSGAFRRRRRSGRSVSDTLFVAVGSGTEASVTGTERANSTDATAADPLHPATDGPEAAVPYGRPYTEAAASLFNTYSCP